jgi:hypothetical protein
VQLGPAAAVWDQVLKTLRGLEGKLKLAAKLDFVEFAQRWDGKMTVHIPTL